LFTVRGVSRVVVIAAQVLAVDLTIRFDWSVGREMLSYALVDEWVMAWTSLPQASWAACGVAAGFLTARCILRRDPIETVSFGRCCRHSPRCRECAGRMGALVVSGDRRAGLSLALVETTYRMGVLRRVDRDCRDAGRLHEALLRVGSRYAVAMVDVDHFKRLNDVFGHEVGDQALRLVAARLSGITGGGKPFRYGGEEFVVLFARATASEAVPHLETARRAIADSSFVLRGPRRPPKESRGAQAAQRTSGHRGPDRQHRARRARPAKGECQPSAGAESCRQGPLPR